MAPVASNEKKVNKSAKRVCWQRESGTMSVETTTRRRYPRRCKGQLPFEVEEQLQLPTRQETKSTGIPRKLTERRKNIIRGFMEEFIAKPHNYANYGTESWISSLLQYMNERPTYGLTATDVQVWIQNEDFFKVEVVNLLSKHVVPEEPSAQNKFPSSVPPCPTSGDVVPEMVKPTDPHSGEFVKPHMLSEVLVARLLGVDVSEVMLPFRPRRILKPRKLKANQHAVLPPLQPHPPPRPAAADNQHLRKLEGFYTNLCECINNIKAYESSPDI
ncbi:unnamed protein product [Orchesella dallaii]|uniref:Uncharacterized protein n=1 Tax=Orchesella dallaii TaxID=48710 RepID=A0ABP1R4D6_9HEXA